ncbi:MULTISPECIES: cob(I)yrinic acid a,c-diamide adenosyltransferase [unclassified Spirosoma]|uniref:cob(I)yrinic acid a,c-diamide adenosyltransferase n=1 Tax=unclassified Spirosoma TaxID=2621999 RepID=UPI00095B6A95|nr:MULTISPECIES: cob(I)yrinic acid a,c-diamide adenosyltransferase [unclassified Spirosoma]MBN8826160.1 cob(I)yrinic acid a,c-diamide adenosyltransferase [Spirosoma sp.]OJW76941.1 MAG: ATP:cob(I)alamin adenosyltransferase [Spirosoma sp. 48-14]
MKIYTKTGDKGQTGLIGGRRVSKADLRIDAYGTIDELNAWIGLVRDQPVNESRSTLLKEIQDRLFTMGAELATDPEKAPRRTIPSITADDIEMLEQAMDTMDTELPELRAFILPGGHQAVSFCHLARTVCRRAERLVITLHEQSPVDERVLQYINRLSDYLFVLGRKMAQELSSDEVVWKPRI